MAFKVDNEPTKPTPGPGTAGDKAASDVEAGQAPLLKTKIRVVPVSVRRGNDHPANRFENPSIFLQWWEQKAMRVMAAELLMLIFWTITCVLLVIVVGYFQQGDAENFVAKLFGKEMAKDHDLLHKFCMLVGMIAALDNFFSMLLLFMLGQGICERNWRKCGLFVLGKLFLIIVACIFLLCLKVGAHSVFVACTRPNLALFIFIVCMMNYRIVATYVLTKYIKSIQAEEFKMEMQTIEAGRGGGFCVHGFPRGVQTFLIKPHVIDVIA